MTRNRVKGEVAGEERWHEVHVGDCGVVEEEEKKKGRRNTETRVSRVKARCRGKCGACSGRWGCKAAIRGGREREKEGEGREVGVEVTQAEGFSGDGKKSEGLGSGGTRAGGGWGRGESEGKGERGRGKGNRGAQGTKVRRNREGEGLRGWRTREEVRERGNVAGESPRGESSGGVKRSSWSRWARVGGGEEGGRERVKGKLVKGEKEVGVEVAGRGRRGDVVLLKWRRRVGGERGGWRGGGKCSGRGEGREGEQSVVEREWDGLGGKVKGGMVGGLRRAWSGPGGGKECEGRRGREGVRVGEGTVREAVKGWVKWESGGGGGGVKRGSRRDCVLETRERVKVERSESSIGRGVGGKVRGEGWSGGKVVCGGQGGKAVRGDRGRCGWGCEGEWGDRKEVCAMRNTGEGEKGRWERRKEAEGRGGSGVCRKYRGGWGRDVRGGGREKRGVVGGWTRREGWSKDQREVVRGGSVRVWWRTWGESGVMEVRKGGGGAAVGTGGQGKVWEWKAKSVGKVVSARGGSRGWKCRVGERRGGRRGKWSD
ncbi:hypothetical protein Tco_0991240 [Tanacetum coccineum]|uniref:Uncharacterized protein n=1 Tax=Tanacetum coccineum TaxID=301880 RepID=A0ABQ5EYP0_9ASTR